MVEDVKQVVGRVLMDATFRALLFSDSIHALRDYDLTPEEFEALSQLTPERIDAMQVSLAEGLGGGRIKGAR